MQTARTALREGRLRDPSELLGPQPDGAGWRIVAWLPGAASVNLGGEPLAAEGDGLFSLAVEAEPAPGYAFRWRDAEGEEHVEGDPYAFGRTLPSFDLHLFAEGRHWHAQRLLGAHPEERAGLDGVRFGVWAPNALRVAVIGDFNGWDGRRHGMLPHAGGVWELFLPGAAVGARYKFQILDAEGATHYKADPFARACELRPDTASIVCAPTAYAWSDEAWREARREADPRKEPLSIYEVHVGSWRRTVHGDFYGFRRLADELVDYVCGLGFTHVELLPISEHPFDGSWGYQTLGYFAPSSRFGAADDLRYFIDRCHQRGLGVLLDWVPAHFPKDPHGLARFDGTALFEHEDPLRGEHPDWGTLIFNYGRFEVQSFLLSSALFWLEEFHFDGLRVDAVASMLYLDYSRAPDKWRPNQHGGRENLEAVAFLQKLNETVHATLPGALVIAEESTSWEGVTHPVEEGGLGFDFKWNLGWMHDTLAYLKHDPIYRQYHHSHLTFGIMYAFTEHFLLPFSHDEVVHGKGSLWNKMHGDPWQRRAHLRLLFCYQFTQPGKKLLFMGSELGQEREWDHDGTLSWELGEQPERIGLRWLLADLHKLYRKHPCLYVGDGEEEGFQWVDCDDNARSVIAYLRCDGDDFLFVALSFTPVVRAGMRFGVPRAGAYREVLNSDSSHYGGGNVGNAGVVTAVEEPLHGFPCSLTVTLPPLGAVILAPEAEGEGG